MISVNLLPKEERTPVTGLGVPPRREFLLPLGIILAVIVPLGAMFLLQTTKLNTLKSDIAVAEQESRRLKPQIQKINQLMRKREELNLKLNLVRNLNRERTVLVQLLDELALQLPAHLWMTKFIQNGPQSLTLEGRTFSNLVVADLMSRLERTDLYTNVDLTVAERELIEEEPVIKFALTTRLTR